MFCIKFLLAYHDITFVLIAIVIVLVWYLKPQLKSIIFKKGILKITPTTDLEGLDDSVPCSLFNVTCMRKTAFRERIIFNSRYVH